MLKNRFSAVRCLSLKTSTEHVIFSPQNDIHFIPIVLSVVVLVAVDREALSFSQASQAITFYSSYQVHDKIDLIHNERDQPIKPEHVYGQSDKEKI